MRPQLVLLLAIAVSGCNRSLDPAVRDAALKCARLHDDGAACLKAYSAADWDEKRRKAYQCLHPKECWQNGEVWLGSSFKQAEGDLAATCRATLEATFDECEGQAACALPGVIAPGEQLCALDVYLEPGDPVKNCERANAW